MNYLIIGSKGFIGSHLMAHLINRGEKVWGADVIVDYTDAERYFLVDASNSDFHSIFENQHFDICVNCSGAASVPDSIQHPMRDYYLNAVNVFKILDSIRIYQSDCKFINLSSAAVYGNPTSLPIREDTVACPVSPYGLHKYQSEQVCSEFYHYFNIKTCSLRVFSAYGDGLRKQLFWDIYQKAKTGIPFTLFGTGNESRDFIHVNDIVNAIDLVSKSDYFKADVINLANGEEIYIKDAVATFFNSFSTNINYSFSKEERKGDPVNWVADISKLKSLGYKSTFNLETGLQQYYKWITLKEKK
ncbi:MAG: GDP-mannose 4,6-dehydratase [Bacteroidota bacterium]|nr:GDP-mannose 4,6-dehydratase [Bacteroidota bacterium]